MQGEGEWGGHLQRCDDVLALDHGVRANVVDRQAARLVLRGFCKQIQNGVAPEGTIGQLAEVTQRALRRAHSAFLAAQLI